ncbi:hypothetical protein ANO11243_058980 [Dothideomycetidae sp. 11243]|nr:hypothetical protein ANO11243_058980 [fungal sp. No.11243]
MARAPRGSRPVGNMLRSIWSDILDLRQSMRPGCTLGQPAEDGARHTTPMADLHRHALKMLLIKILASESLALLLSVVINGGELVSVDVSVVEKWLVSNQLWLNVCGPRGEEECLNNGLPKWRCSPRANVLAAARPLGIPRLAIIPPVNPPQVARQ